MIIVGIALLGYSGIQMWSSNEQQQAALLKAEQRIMDQAKSEGPVVFDPKIGEEIGVLSLPKLDSTLPIIEGVDESELSRGVGHYYGTSFPDDKGQIVLSGHRDTVFRRIGELEIGDELVVNMPYGNFTYIIEETEIVEAGDTTVIRPEQDEELLTVTTCYPFRYVGDAPDRYIIYAKPKS
ncbi:class D sortase [Ammoniphilus oxalaticus]|uniref:Class D sortase n=2 Tax=Ammoniphilus oxalaticus TaxID=66863 RepID=A0A419SP23_9BACL|nr:class D sortase [Ammoniphilus oxalaticus]